jgi:putative transposase
MWKGFEEEVCGVKNQNGYLASQFLKNAQQVYARQIQQQKACRHNEVIPLEKSLKVIDRFQSQYQRRVLNVLEMELTIREIAEIVGMTHEAIRKRSKKGSWSVAGIKIEGGRPAETFRLEDIDEDLKFKIQDSKFKIQNHPLADPGRLGEPYGSGHPGSARSGERIPAQRQAVTEKQRKIALARMDLVRAWLDYRQQNNGQQTERQEVLFQTKKRMTDLDKEFEMAYNQGVLFPYIYETLGRVDIQTLYRWRQALDGTWDWQRLIPQWNNGNGKGPRLTEEEKKTFLSILLNPRRLKVGSAVKLTKFYLEKKGIESPSHPITFKRFAKKFQEQHYDIWVLMREGQKALRDRVEPFIKRDPSLLEVGDVLVADGHRLNFKVINPFTGKPCRATLVGYIDWKSYALAGYEIMIEENIQCITSALRNSILKLGKMPKVCYMDNGKAFRARFFTSVESFDETGIYGLYARLGIVPVFAQPYNARAKVIERWFKEFTSTFERLMPSYTGSSIEDKPAYMLRNEKFHKAIHNEYIPTIEEAIQLIEAWLKFHNSQPCPHVKGKTIGEVFEEGKGDGVDEAQLDDLMMDMKISTIGRNGIRFLKADYYDDNLYGYRGQVLIRYSLFDLSHIKVYDLKGNFLCIAKRQMPVHPMAQHLGNVRDVEDLKRRIAQQRRLERQTIRLVSEMSKFGKHVELDWQRVSPRVIDKLEVSDISLPATEKRIPDECVIKMEDGKGEKREESIKRPIFLSDIERYEWHLQNGIHTEEDKAWVEWFRKTDEYKIAFEWFENQQRKEVIG